MKSPVGQQDAIEQAPQTHGPRDGSMRPANLFWNQKTYIATFVTE